MPNPARIDATDARLLLALAAHPRATTVALAEASGLSRNTVQARLAGLDRSGAVGSFERRVDPATLGYPLTAFVTTRVAQRRLDEVAGALAAVPEVLQVHGLTGDTDLLVHVVATDAEDLYRVAGQILDIPGVERTSTALVMRQLVDYRLAPLLRRAAARR
ncbi:AsnC family transcriptional regulator [Streptomyces sp. 3MP-14]|uniref:AsnC family transcriptional regulator n=1 Tax=Streptomyces mimosae TaxID=2586635 RepID=A0A5N5ZUC0_9ACTN|nr:MULTISPECIES: Lrp/AsnC family transcriptional regulator [Streptomyces]KAB8159453.1 AsnC family transcriptional regulator [Streptomyces mimosae]KAB8172659.1 AsnC family transcriptional regulator [Streptomyces sp. 3MP-14]